MQLRNKVSRSRRAGVQVAEVGVDVPATASASGQLDDLDAQWLAAKGRHTKELTFLVGERGGPAAALRRLFVAQDAQGEPLAYVSFSPTWGPQSGWLHDLSRRRPDAPPGALEHVVVTAVERFRSEGAGFLHFGFTPFTSLDGRHEQPGASALVRRIVRPARRARPPRLPGGRPARVQGQVGPGRRAAAVRRLRGAAERAGRLGPAPADRSRLTMRPDRITVSHYPVNSFMPRGAA